MSATPERFIGELVIRAIPHWEIPDYDRRGVQLYQVQQPFGFLSSFGKVMVPIGFISDFGSVPTVTKAIVDDDDPDLLFASLPHDWLYKTKGVIDNNTKVTRYQADCILREAMLSAGAPAFKSWLIFRAVRIGGGRPWGRPVKV